MNTENKHSRLNRKGASVEFKDDDYETPSNVLNDLVPYINPHSTIYDPFYCNGKIIEEWKTLGFTCINEKLDAFNRQHPEFDYLISNIPFTLKQKCVDLAFSFDKPFMLLMPIDSLGSKWISKYWDKLQFIIPQKRYNFIKNGLSTKGAWFDTMWVCYKINLSQKIIKL
jgi:hypothetical protein